MRKIFTFIAAMLIALTANAGNVWNITNSEEGNLRRCLRDNAQTGDTIVLADGEYEENQSYNVRHDVVIKAAAGARPVIKQKSYLNLYASAQIIGIKFKYVGTSDGYCIYFRENSPKYLSLEGCEFQDFTNYAFMSWDKFHIDSCIVNNCYFHDLSKGAFYFPKSTLTNDTNACDKLKVTNSTFANITLADVAVLDLRNNNNSTAATSELIVDHCTFYKCRGYERMIQTYKTPKGTVSNCIMMNPLDADTVSPIYATYLYGGAVKNCLEYQTKGHRDWDTHPTFTDTIMNRDPLFQDAANGDFALGIGSPAIGAATDGSNLGDPRWGVVRTLYCKMDKSWWTDGNAAIGAYAWGDGVAANAAWPGVRMARVSDDSENPEEYKTWKIDLASRYTSVVFTRMNPSNEGDQYWGAKTNDLVIPAHLNLYTITSDEAKWDDDTHDHQKVAGSWSTKDAKFYIVGSMTDWEDAKKIGCTEDSYTLKGLAAGIHQFKIVDAENGAWLGMADLKNIASGGLFLYPDTYGNICFKLATAGDATITFKKNTELTVEGDLTVPAMSIVGSLVGGWEAVNIKPMETALDMRTATYTVENLAVQDGYEFKLIFDGMWITREGDNDTYYTIHSGWKKVDGLGMDSEGKKSIKLNASEAGNYIFTWDYATGTMNVSFPTDATGIINTEAGEKAVKVLKNGQLFIEKGNKIYNVLGVQIR